MALNYFPLVRPASFPEQVKETKNYNNNLLNYYELTKERNIVSGLHEILFIKKLQEM